MGESIQEQMAYGDHCVHGTAIGTPGGADLMCGACEMGLTRWVDEERFEIRFAFDPADNPPPERYARFGVDRYNPANEAEVQAVSDQIVELLRQSAEALGNGRVAEGFQQSSHFEAVRVSTGYWDEPLPNVGVESCSVCGAPEQRLEEPIWMGGHPFSRVTYHSDDCGTLSSRSLS